MKTIRLLVCITVAVVLVGCNEPFDLRKLVSMPSMPVNIQKQSSVPLAPNLGKGVVLGTVSDVNDFTIEVILYEPLDVVCIQHRSLQYSRNCWDVDIAPKKVQGMVKKYTEMKYVPIQ